MIEYRLSLFEDIRIVADNMRSEDIREVASASGSSPYDALLAGYVKSTECFTIYQIDTGRPVAMFGYSVEPDGVGSLIWMLGTDDLTKHSRVFLKRSRAIVDHIQTKATILYNAVDSRNQVHIRWLSWLGFKFVSVIEEFGKDKLPFIEFVRIK